MTWKEFKDFIDADLKKRGVSEDIEIGYIDISWPDTFRSEAVEVEDETLRICE